MAENLNPLENDPENQQIAERIQALFVRANIQEGGYEVWDRYEDKFSIEMEVLESDGKFFRGGVDIKSKLPSDLDYPIYILDFHTFQYPEVKLTQARNTPYGFLPIYVIGSDGQLYEYGNYYFFNSKGAGLKYEDVWSLGNPSSFHSDAFIADIGRVEFIPNEEDSRFVPLEAGDYEMIKGYLEMIESGEFKALHRFTR